MANNTNKNYIGVGIIGCGKISQVRHIPEYAANENVRIVGYFDQVYERAKEMAEKYGGIAFSTLDEILSCAEIDAVSVCTANKTHRDITLSALKQGKHVLCEKPMAATKEECIEMAEASRAAGKWLMLAHNQRFCTLHKRAKEILDNGEIGQPLTFHTTFGTSGPENWSVDKGASTWFFDRARSGLGVMGDLGIHKVDLMRYLLGCDVSEISATLGTLDKKYESGEPIDVEDNAVAICRMENGVIGTVTVSWTHYGVYQNDTTIYGSDGVLSVCELTREVTVKKRGGVCNTEVLPPDKSSGVIDAFIDAIKENKEPVSSADTTIQSMFTVFGVFESSKNATHIKLK